MWSRIFSRRKKPQKSNFHNRISISAYVEYIQLEPRTLYFIINYLVVTIERFINFIRLLVLMIIEQLANYPPWSYRPAYCSAIQHPGDTRIILRDTTDTQKHDLEELMDSMFVRNELLNPTLQLSHEPNSAVKCWIRQLPFGHHFFHEPGLRKVRGEEYPEGGCRIKYQSGRTGNPYPKITLDSDYYGASMMIGPINEHPVPVDAVYIFVHLHRQDYGDLLINEIIKRFNPDFSEKLKEREKVKGRYEKRSMTEDAL